MTLEGIFEAAVLVALTPALLLGGFAGTRAIWREALRNARDADPDVVPSRPTDQPEKEAPK